MLIKKQSANKIEKDWLFFSVPLAFVLSHDYLALRLLYYLEPLSTAFTILGKMIDIAEKSLKLFVTVMHRSPTALTNARSDFGHNIEKSRLEAATFNSAFNDPDIVAFSKGVNDKSGKLYQHIRYGSEETTEGFSADPALLMPVMDKIFYEAFLCLPPNDRRLLFFGSPIKSLLQKSSHDQSRNPQLLTLALQSSNAYFDSIAQISAQLDAEYANMMEAKQVASGGQHEPHA